MTSDILEKKHKLFALPHTHLSLSHIQNAVVCNTLLFIHWSKLKWWLLACSHRRKGMQISIQMHLLLTIWFDFAYSLLEFQSIQGKAGYVWPLAKPMGALELNFHFCIFGTSPLLCQGNFCPMVSDLINEICMFPYFRIDTNRNKEMVAIEIIPQKSVETLVRLSYALIIKT